MDEIILGMLKDYNCKTKADFNNALKEIIQEVALLGLWRSKFFEYSAFYGGTALRVLYGLNRFSEDMDFSLLKVNPKFDLNPHITAIEQELKTFGFDVSVESKDKKQPTQIESAFIKGGTKILFLNAKAPNTVVDQTQSNEMIKIKLELDTKPPLDFDVEMKNLLKPIPFQVKTMTLESLFAGKLHAVLARKWKTRVKGRDFYDLIWYMGKKIKPDLNHLRSRLIQSGDWQEDKEFTKAIFKSMLSKKIESTDFEAAKEDISPFLKQREQASLDLWSREYFLEVIEPL